MKEAAWGARPRTVTAAALLGDRLNNRRPAPICMGVSDGPGLELGGPTPVGQPRGYPGLCDYPPSPRPPFSSSGLPAECEKVVGEGLGWRGGGNPPLPRGSTPGWFHVIPVCRGARDRGVCHGQRGSLSRRTSGAARADQAARRPWDSVELLHVVSFGCVEWFVGV